MITLSTAPKCEAVDFSSFSHSAGGSATLRESTLRSAWQDPQARESIKKVLTQGMLLHAPLLATQVLQKIDELSHCDLDDNETAAALRRCFADKHDQQMKDLSFKKDEDLRIAKRALQINQIVKGQPRSYLDIGCGNGQIATILACNWLLQKQNCFGVDVYNRTSADAGFTFRDVRNGQFDLADEAVELSTMLMTLHHESNPLKLMQEAFRTLKAGGTLIIRDHNAESESDKLFFRALDMIYFSIFSDSKEVPQPANYQSATFWFDLAHDCGFKVEKCFNPEPDSPIKPFHMLLRKPSL